MRFGKFSRMKDGWWIGDFEPAMYRTTQFEVAYKTHKAGDEWPEHYQRTATEINLLIKGRMRINKAWLLGAGDMLLVEAGEPIKPEFLEECEIIVVKIPSLPNDKVVIEKLFHKKEKK